MRCSANTAAFVAECMLSSTSVTRSLGSRLAGENAGAYGRPVGYAPTILAAR